MNRIVTKCNVTPLFFGVCFNAKFLSLGEILYVNAPVYTNLGAVSIRKTVLPDMAIPMLKIRRPNGRLIFNMEIAIRR